MTDNSFAPGNGCGYCQSLLRLAAIREGEEAYLVLAGRAAARPGHGPEPSRHARGLITPASRSLAADSRTLSQISHGLDGR
jgi:hypothetical protein